MNSLKEKKQFSYSHMIFIPLKNKAINAITEKFSMETYIFLYKRTIFGNLNETGNIFTLYEELINNHYLMVL